MLRLNLIFSNYYIAKPYRVVLVSHTLNMHHGNINSMSKRINIQMCYVWELNIYKDIDNWQIH